MSDATLHPVGATTPSSAPAVDDRPARSLRRRLRAPLLTSLVVQIVLVLGDRMPSVDAMSYFETGRNWVDGKGYTHGSIARGIGTSGEVTGVIDRFLKGVFR